MRKKLNRGFGLAVKESEIVLGDDSMQKWNAILRIGCFLLTGSCTLRAQPQAFVIPASPASSASVTGTVIFGDTQRPARFVQVDLQAIPSAPATSNDGARRGFGVFGGGGSFARTGLDGTFTISSVAPGDYWVLATAPGYVSERTLLQVAANAGATAADLLTQMPTVHVSASGGGSVTLTLVRGAALSGRLQWEDGSPATGLDVAADPTATPVALPSPLNSLRAYSTTRAVTDDRGAFRLLGLPGGDYVLEVQMHPTAQFGGGGRGYANMIRVYAPGVFRKADAKPLTVKAGDERDDLRLVLNLSKLHTVSGHVNSATAGFNVLSGRVSLVDTTDATLQMSGTINAAGDFSILYVPPGTYTLSAQGSPQSATIGYRGRSGTPATAGPAFQPYTQTLTVGETDVTGMEINLLSAQ